MITPVNQLAWLNMSILQGLLIKELKPNVSGVRRMTIQKNGFVHGVLVLKIKVIGPQMKFAVHK